MESVELLIGKDVGMHTVYDFTKYFKLQEAKMNYWMKCSFLTMMLAVMIVSVAAQVNAAVDTSGNDRDPGLSLLFAQGPVDDSSILLAQGPPPPPRRDLRRDRGPRRDWDRRRYPRRYWGRGYDGPPPPYRHRRYWHRRHYGPPPPPPGPPPPPFGPPPGW